MTASLTTAVTRRDLLEALASADWALTQLPDLTKRLDTWIDSSIRMELCDPGP